MRFWAALLRALGTALILLTLNEVITVTSRFPVLDSWLAFSNFLRPQIERLALVALCFGAASVILTIHKISVRQAQATARRRPVQNQPPPSPLPQLSWETDTQPIGNFAPAYPQRDLAPVAPDWDELPRRHPMAEEPDSGSREIGAKVLARLLPQVSGKHQSQAASRRGPKINILIRRRKWIGRAAMLPIRISEIAHRFICQRIGNC